MTITPAVHASAIAEVRTRLDDLVSRARVPGIQYVAVTADHTIIDYAGGWADLAARRPMRQTTSMMAYSMSKTITAAAVLRLVDAGRIGLDDPIDRHVPSEPYGQDVTIRHLLTHTGGLPNPIPLAWVHQAERHETFNESAALAEVLRKHATRASPPGARYRYSNIGYWLLGPIVEAASGEPFVTYVQRHVLAPLGITPADLGYAVRDRDDHAHGYLEKYSMLNLVKGFFIDKALLGRYSGSWLHIRDHYLNGPAFGGLVGSAKGFAAFLQDQLRVRSALFSDATRQLFYARQTTRTGRPVAMTPGWHVMEGAHGHIFFKEGGGGGFHSMMRLYPYRGLGTVVIVNATGFDVRGLLDELDPMCRTMAS